MSLDYLKFVESHEKYRNFNVFEKVLMATQRAKAIYEEEKVSEEEEDLENKKKRKKAHKPTYQAILEINEGKVQLNYSERKPLPPSPEPVEADNTISEDQPILTE